MVLEVGQFGQPVNLIIIVGAGPYASLLKGRVHINFLKGDDIWSTCIYCVGHPLAKGKEEGELDPNET